MQFLNEINKILPFKSRFPWRVFARFSSAFRSFDWRLWWQVCDHPPQQVDRAGSWPPWSTLEWYSWFGSVQSSLEELGPRRCYQVCLPRSEMSNPPLLQLATSSMQTRCSFWRPLFSTKSTSECACGPDLAQVRAHCRPCATGDHLGLIHSRRPRSVYLLEWIRCVPKFHRSISFRCQFQSSSLSWGQKGRKELGFRLTRCFYQLRLVPSFVIIARLDDPTSMPLSKSSILDQSFKVCIWLRGSSSNYCGCHGASKFHPHQASSANEHLLSGERVNQNANGEPFITSTTAWVK